jgi:endonuclease YncB( thermonuclease family)
MRKLWQIVAVTVSIASCAPAVAAIGSETVRVHDGDTFTVGRVRWRLWGIDAPELKQSCPSSSGATACGISAREHLRELIGDDAVSCTEAGRSYDRAVGRCSAGGVDLSAAMVRDGFAVEYARYSRGAYADDEVEARKHRRGIWSHGGSLGAPWEFRHGR